MVKCPLDATSSLSANHHQVYEVIIISWKKETEALTVCAACQFQSQYVAEPEPEANGKPKTEPLCTRARGWL